MRKNKFLMAGAAFALAVGLASCNVNDEIEDNPLVHFTAGIEQAKPVSPGSRAAGTSWSEGDAVGVFMTEGTAVTGSNKQYIISNVPTGSFKAAGEAEQLYFPLTGAEVSFIAYYPYRSGAVINTPVSVEIATAQTAGNQPEYDLLYSDNATGYSKTNGSVTLTFQHKLAKLVMNCKAADNMGVPLDGMKVTVNGMNTRSTFDLSTGTLGSTETVAAITPLTITDGAAYDAIILPDTYADGVVTVDFTVNPGTAQAETFTWDVGAVTFGGGNQYTYQVTLTRSGVEATGTITPWTDNDRGGVTAE